MNRKRDGIVALAAGAALSAAWPEIDLAPVAWCALVPLLLVTERAPLRRAAALGFAYGAAFFGVLLVWISLVGWLGWALLVALQASFVALFALAWSLARRRVGYGSSVLLAPALWVAIDFLRSVVPLGGFTWGQLAQSQHDLGWMLRSAAVGGGWLVTALVVLVNAAVALLVRFLAQRAFRRAVVAGALGVVALAAPLALPAAAAAGRPVRVAIVQGGVPRRAPSLFDKELAIIRSHERLTAAAATRRPELVVWPESSVGLDLQRTPEAAAAVARAARSVAAPMIVGGNLDVGEDRYLVMAFEISPGGDITDRYQKTHLVPFGEYVPARALLGWIPMLDQVPRDAIAGEEPVIFDVAGGRVAPVISFEGDFGSLVRTRIDAGGRLLVVATNTSTWGRSWASAQHLAFSQVRAAENGVWVAHAAITGISGFVAPTGEVVAETAIGDTTAIARRLRFAASPTFYARTGDWFALTCLGVGVLAVVAGLRSPSAGSRR
jgi:apolipoprotein N-acyltransferase